MIVLFFGIPFWQSGLKKISWIGEVKKLMDSMLGDRIETEQDALLYYIILFTLVISLFAGAMSIIFKTVSHNPERRESLNSELSEKYGFPAAVLIVAGMMLILIFEGGKTLHGITNIWITLLAFILFILLCLAAVELVRLALEQCLLSGSLLSKLLRLIFTVTLEFITSLILSIFTRLRIQSLVSSLFYLVFPEQNEELQNRVDSIINRLLFKELDSIVNDLGDDSTRPNGGFRKFYRKRTWRRRK